MAPDDRPDDPARLSPRVDTIFALSSGQLPAAVAIVRVSGPGAESALAALAGRVPEPRRATTARLRDASGDLLDHALILWFPGPGTATGEDVAELHLHGGRAVAAAVLAALAVRSGLRLAESGEFTRRAVLNGRLDLTQAEGMADLLQAETEGQRRQALRAAEGGLTRLIAGWRDRLLTLAAQVEAAIDFDEEDAVASVEAPCRDAIGLLAADIGSALRQPPAERLRDGPRIVLAGPVNSGKSSLLNCLAGREAAIASPHEGTTRDLIEVPVQLDGLACVLVDSAGVRDAVDAVERLGVERARGAIASADLLLWFGDPGEHPSGPATIVIQPRCDLPDRRVAVTGVDAAVSIHDSASIARLRHLIASRVTAMMPGPEATVLNLRHRTLLHDAMTEIRAAGSESELILAAERLRAAGRCFDRVVGAAGTEEMLDALFARFCVGK